jgi:hypothetical protein
MSEQGVRSFICLRGGIAFSLGFTAVIFWYFFIAEKRTEKNHLPTTPSPQQFYSPLTDENTLASSPLKTFSVIVMLDPP